MSNIYLIEVNTSYITRLFRYQGSEPPTESQVAFSYGEEAANDIEGINVYSLDELEELRIKPEKHTVSIGGNPFRMGPCKNYSIYVDQLETALVEAVSEESARVLFLRNLTLGKLLSMVRVSALADCVSLEG